MECPWNSLEVVKVIISIATPVIGACIAYRLAKLGKEIEKKQWAGRKIIEKRIEFYDNVVPELNELYCYYNRVGTWKDKSPIEIIEIKRKLDKEFHVYDHIFKGDILKQYRRFIHKCFKTYTGSGNDAKLKMNLTKRIDLPNWNSEWNELFVEEEMVSHKEFDTSYDTLLKLIKAELEV